MPVKDADQPRSPGWWLLRLGRQLRKRREQLDEWYSYYIGEPPLPQGPAKAAEAFQDFMRKARTNLCGAAVESSVFRLEAVGITDRNGRPDDEAWTWWNVNRLDARQKSIYRLALGRAWGYVMVGPHPREATRPLITVEHPNEVIVAQDPVTLEREAALKAWTDEVEGHGRATVYLRGGRLVRYQTTDRRRTLPWSEQSWDVVEEAETPFDQPPVVPFECRPEVGEPPRPEYWAGVDIQDRINLGLLNRMTAERYTAFRQKWVKGHKFNKREVTEVDPATGLDVIRYEVTEQPFVPDPGSVWASEGENTQFGEFSQTDLSGYLRSHQSDIRDFLFVTHSPAYLYSTDLINVSSETVAALESMHIAKVKEHMASFADAWEDVVSLAAVVAGSDVDRSQSEIAWRDPRQLNPAVVADAATKKAALGYPLAIVAEDLGESPQRVRRIVQQGAYEAVKAALLAQQQGGQAQGGQQPAAPRTPAPTAALVAAGRPQ